MSGKKTTSDAATRTGSVKRKTRETDIRVSLSLDEVAATDVDTGVPFLDHMLNALSRHGHLGLSVAAKAAGPDRYQGWRVRPSQL